MTSAYAADPVFEANAKQISYLLQRIHNGELALPDFQRNFVWETKRTLELLRSVMCRFPTGTLLFWKQGSGNDGFAEREVEGAPPLNGKQPDELVLDGQQRLTSLYRALTGAAEERYFVRLNEFLSDAGALKPAHDVDFDKAIFAVDTSSRLKFDPSDRQWQYAEGAFPLAELDSFDEWLDRYARKISDGHDAEDATKRAIRAVRDAYLVPLRSYGFPVVTLPETTPLEAVCNIFETLNRTGRPLGAFELLTARFYPKGVNLRDLWLAAKEQYDVFDEFRIEPYDILQAISLRARNSAQRSDVLSKLTAEEVSEHWPLVVTGMASVLDTLKNEYGVLHYRWLPYGMLLVPMAAVWPDIRSLRTLERANALERLSQYFWCTTFMTNYDQGANSQAGADYLRLKGWLVDADKQPPEAVSDFDFSEATLLTAGVRRKALHAGIMALTIRSGAKDFHAGQKLTPGRVAEKKIESHHIFPKAYLTEIGDSRSELIVNRALIDSETNKVIGRKAPSVYLAEMREAYGSEKLSDILESHAVPTGDGSGLESDDYEAFLAERCEVLIALIGEVTGKTVARSA